MRQRFEIHITHKVNELGGLKLYRAELWSGYMVACSRWCRTKSWARRYAHVFRVDAKL